MTVDEHRDPDPLDPDRAQRHPEDAVDALEQRVLGGPEHRLDGGHPDDVGPTDQPDATADQGREDPDPEAAFAIDLDPEDQGSSAAAASNPD